MKTGFGTDSNGAQPGRRVLSPGGMETIHAKALQILRDTGLRVMHRGFYPGLEAAGAAVDHSSGVVRFPHKLVEDTIEGLRGQIGKGHKQNLMNGVTSPHTEDGALRLKFAGAAIEYLDPLSGEVRAPEDMDLIRLIALGESMPEVSFIGNPVCVLRDGNGSPVPGPLQRIKTAAAVAKYTTKYGSNEVWNERELELLIELGGIVRGGRDGFFKNPCFMTAKETISPLIFPEDDGRILAMLAERGLPCTVIPMPISGGTSPVTAAANIAVCTAEVLGALACIRASYPCAMAGGGVLSGVMDMRKGQASFAAPEAILQDLGAANLFADMYGQNFAIGAGYIDAAAPGAQASVEILAKIRASHDIGHCYYPVGLLKGGKRWSPVQAFVGLEMAEYVHRAAGPLQFGDGDIPVGLVGEVGIGGNFFGCDHTLDNYRQNVWFPELMERTSAEGGVDAMVENARQKWSDFLKKDITPAVDRETEREIDEWERISIKILTEGI